MKKLLWIVPIICVLPLLVGVVDLVGWFWTNVQLSSMDWTGVRMLFVAESFIVGVFASAYIITWR